MKRFLIAVSILLSACNCLADDINDVLRLIEKNNITLQALHHENDALLLDRKAENAIAGPSIEYTPFYKNGYTGLAESELIVSEEIEFPTKYAARNKQTALQKQANEQQYARMRRDILLEAELLCLDIIRANQTLQMLQQRLADSQTLKEMYEKRMEAGDANILELNKVKLDCMEVQTLVSEAESERTLLLQQLQQLNGGEMIEISSIVFPEIEMVKDYESFLHLALASDADIMMAETNVKSAAQDVAITKKEWLPNISLGYRRNTEMKEQVNGVLVGLSFPIISNSSKVKAARQRQQSAELQLQQARKDAESSLKARYLQLTSLQQVLDHSDVEMMKETLGLLAKALQHGEITSLQYYTEIDNIYEKLQRHIDVHCQSTKLLAELHRNEL